MKNRLFLYVHMSIDVDRYNVVVLFVCLFAYLGWDMDHLRLRPERKTTRSICAHSPTLTPRPLSPKWQMCFHLISGLAKCTKGKEKLKLQMKLWPRLCEQIEARHWTIIHTELISYIMHRVRQTFRLH